MRFPSPRSILPLASRSAYVAHFHPSFLHNIIISLARFSIAHNFAPLTIVPGDRMRLTISILNRNKALLVIENIARQQTVTELVTSTTPLCQQNVQWIVEDPPFMNSSFADFSTLTYFNAAAYGAFGDAAPTNGTMIDIQKNCTIETTSRTTPSSVTINYDISESCA